MAQARRVQPRLASESPRSGTKTAAPPEPPEPGDMGLLRGTQAVTPVAHCFTRQIDCLAESRGRPSTTPSGGRIGKGLNEPVRDQKRAASRAIRPVRVSTLAYPGGGSTS